MKEKFLDVMVLPEAIASLNVMMIDCRLVATPVAPLAGEDELNEGGVVSVLMDTVKLTATVAQIFLLKNSAIFVDSMDSG